MNALIRIVLAVSAAALAIFGASSLTGASSVLPIASSGAVTQCGPNPTTALTYRLRQPATIPSGLTQTLCEIRPHGTFAAVTIWYKASDRGWINVEHLPSGSSVDQRADTSIETVSIAGKSVALGSRTVNGVQVLDMAWNDGDVTLVVHAALTNMVTRVKVLEFARSLH